MADHNVTRAIEALEGGEPTAAERLFPLVYEELRRLARKKMAQEAVEHTLQPTALVHEAYLRLLHDASNSKWENRAHFYAAAAEAMRRILIETARRKSSLKRGHGRLRVEFTEEVTAQATNSAEDLLLLNDALEKLEIEDAETYRLVMLRYFGGLTIEEAALSLGVSLRTANRHWSFARAWLKREMNRIRDEA